MTHPLALRSWADLSLRTKGLVVLGLPVAAMIAIGVLALTMQRADARSERLVLHTAEVRLTTEQLYTALLNADTGIRGFLLTNDESFLEPFRIAERSVPALAARLDGLVEVNTVRAQLPTLNALVAARWSQWTALSQASGGPSAGDLGILLREGRETMNALRHALAELTASESQLLAERLEAHERLRRRNRTLLMAGLGVGIVGGGIATLLLTSGIVGRAQQLEVSAGALAAGAPVESMASADDELGRVHAAMQRASRLLREREAALREANDSIHDLNVALERRLQEQSALNAELEAFSYSVSHDLRAPLRSIDGFSQALLEDYHDQLDSAGQQYLGRVRAAAQRMAQLIDDILMLSRVTRTELRAAPVDLSALARETVAAIQEHDPARRATWRIEPGLCTIGDPQLLRIALENLLDNAWKFTGRTPEAVIEFARVGDDGTYVVSDNGAGFDMAYADKLFGAFQRLHALADFSGTGIGLATVQRIITKHGGRVWAEGEVERGARFYFTLPSSERRDT